MKALVFQLNSINTTMKKYKIGIADDHLLFAEGIRNLLLKRKDLEMVFITSSVSELFDLLKNSPIDILMLDINIPPYNGIELLKEIKHIHRELKIMTLTMYQPMDINLNMKQFPGDAYVLKISGMQILEDAIAHLQNNSAYIDPNIINKPATDDNSAGKLRLTKREKEIVTLIAEGKTSKEIAAQLFLSELTIKTHRKNISEKLDSKGIADLILKSNHLLK